MFGEQSQKLIVGLVIAGFVLSIGAAVLLVVLSVMSTQGNLHSSLAISIPVLVFACGFFCFVAAVIAGWKNVGFKDSSQPIAIEPNSYIVACFILDKKGENVFDPEMYEPGEIEYMVQIEFRTGDKHEFKTSPEVFGTLGEGLVGKVHFQGRTLLKFERDLTGKHERRR